MTAQPPKQPWMKFYPSDWKSDDAVRICSLGARGLWIEMLCLMHQAAPRGSLLINGKHVSVRQLAGLSGAPVGDIEVFLLELEEAGVFSRDEDGTIYSRRIRRDEAKAAIDRANGLTGGNPGLKKVVNPSNNGKDKAQKPEARDQKPEKKDSEPIGSAAGAAIDEDAKTILFSSGLEWLAKETNKPPDKLRSVLGQMLKDIGGDTHASALLGIFRDAKREGKAEPLAWIKATIAGRARASPVNGKGWLGAAKEFVFEESDNGEDGKGRKSGIGGNVRLLSTNG